MMRLAVLALALALAPGCGTRLAVESDPNVRHAAWRTWSWLPRPPVAHGDNVYAAVDDRVRAAFDREMKLRGFRRVDRERPDFLLTYYAAVEKPIDSKAVAYAAGGPSSAKSAANAQGLYVQGMLLVDVLDPRSGRLVWRGVGKGVFEPQQTPEDRRARIDDAVASVAAQLSDR
jgi:hypothetical protein